MTTCPPPTHPCPPPRAAPSGSGSVARSAAGRPRWSPAPPRGPARRADPRGADGCCPHTTIRDDITANLDAVEELGALHDPDLVLVESGGDNLTATFSYGLVDRQIFVVDVAGGDKVPRKGGPGVIRSDLLVINKTDLAPLVGADLEVMRTDAERLRGERPTLLLSLRERPDAGPVADGVAALVRARRS